MSREILLWCGYTLAALAMIYGLTALIAVRRCGALRRRTSAAHRCAAARLPPVTVLKPLCGAEPETYECLRSFCEQAYPRFELIFGVGDSQDEAAVVVRRLQREYPQRDIRLVADRTLHGSSRKVSNLINMSAHARHAYWVLADSDVRVQPDYLERVVAPLLDPSVGIVTCLYAGVPRRDWCSQLAAMFINEWFMPSVMVAATSGSRAFAFGATIALRRTVLARIGGFAAIANQLADDYRLGELTRRLGLRTVLAQVVVEICVADSDPLELLRHELRWLRTIRMLKPLGFGFSFITLALPVAALGMVLAGGAAPAAAMFAVSCASRGGLHLATRRGGSLLRGLSFVPLRDALTLLLWAWSFTNRSVRWREWRYEVAADGTAEGIVEGRP